MEQHAVPQDITGFKFKLVGDMTLKQFGELAGGAILAYLFYASNWHPFLKWPFVILFGLLGVALAFVPIEERPLDLWIINFFRAIYRPTLYVWKKTAGAGFLASDNLTTKPKVPKPLVSPQPLEEPTAEPTLWPYPKAEGEEKEKEAEKVEPEIKETGPEEQVPPPPATPALSIDELAKLREQKIAELEEAKRQLHEAAEQAKEEAFKTQVGPSVVTVEQLAKLRAEKVAQQDQELKSQVGVGETELNQLISQNKNLVSQIEEIKTKIGSLTEADAAGLKQKLDALLVQKDNLSARIAALSDRLAAQRAAPLTQPAYQEPRVAATAIPGVRVMTKPRVEGPVTVSLSDQPNVISGMVISEKGAPIEGAIILIKDKAGSSIRALKTNKLGQFVVATPMENGTYYVELEKAGYKFNVLEVTLTGQVLAPLEIPAIPAPATSVQ